MQYFKRELWLNVNIQARTQEHISFDNDEWMTNLHAYQEQLTILKPRLGARIYQFFAKTGLHDGTLLKLCTGDKFLDYPGNVRRTEPYVTLEVLDTYQNNQYTLMYEGIRRLVFDYPSEKPLFHYHDCGPIGDWGYDELTAVDKTYLRHEVLFSSGTILLIEFMRFKYKKAHVRNS